MSTYALILLALFARVFTCTGLRKDRELRDSLRTQGEYYLSEFHIGARSNNWDSIVAKSSNEINFTAGRDSFQRTVNLSFDFPFFDNPVRTLTVMMNGYVSFEEGGARFVGPPKRYIAPLMPNCGGCSISSKTNSSVKWHDTGSSFVVQWENMVLRARPYHKETFSFQLILDRSGSIFFYYKNLPSDIRAFDFLRGGDIRIGAADYFVYEKTPGQKDMWFHLIELARFDENPYFQNRTILMLWPHSSCFQFKNCYSCSNAAPFNGLKCGWCSAANRCASEMDFKRPELSSICRDVFYRESINRCPAIKKVDIAKPKAKKNSTKGTENGTGKNRTDVSANVGRNGVALLFSVVIAMIAPCCFMLYFCVYRWHEIRCVYRYYFGTPILQHEEPIAMLTIEEDMEMKQLND